MSEAHSTVQCLARVSGRVQGVFFRVHTKKMADSLGILGYAKNLANGDVEVLAVGSSAKVQELLQWLWQGSPAAKVTDVTTTSVTGHQPQHFITC